jgi:signal transduction histidine kinase/DNA-binding response OmpR family regulator/streptogramin lyase
MVLLAAGEVRFERISVADGLPQSSITAMTQCADGYMWFGTQYGLNRYDGYRFETFSHDPDVEHSLSNSAIRSLKTTGSGYLWVATRDGLNRFQKSIGLAQRYVLPDSMMAHDARSWLETVGRTPDGALFVNSRGLVGMLAPGSDRIEKLAFDPEVDPELLRPSTGVVDHRGRLWVLNAAGLWVSSRSDRSMVKVHSIEPVAHNGRPILQMGHTADGRLAMAAGNGLKLIDPDHPQQVQRIRPSQRGHADDGIEGLAAASDGTLWLVLDTTLVRYRPDDDEWQVVLEYGERESGTRQDVRLQVIEDLQGDFWLAGAYGVARWSSEQQRLQLFFHDPGDDRSLPASLHPFGYRLFMDDQGTIWIASHLGGLARFSPQAHRFEHIRDRSPPGRIPYAGHNIVRGIVEQPVGEREYLWTALDGAGLRQWLRGPDGRYRWVNSFHASASLSQRLPGDQLWDVIADPESGLIWALESNHLVAIDPRQSAVQAIVSLPELSNPVRANALRLARDGSEFWVATNRGIIRYRFEGEARLQLEEVGQVLAGRHVRDLIELADGHWLTAGRDGLGLISPNADLPEQYFFSESLVGSAAVEFHGLARDHQGRVWVGSNKRGLGRVLLNEGSQSPTLVWYGMDQGLVDPTVYAMLPESEGWLWLSSNRGLMRFNPESGKLHHFTPPDGVQHLEFNNTVAHIGPSGRFYFGGVNGVNAFFPTDIRIMQQAPRVRLQEVLLNGTAYPLDLSRPARLELPHHRNDLDIRFVGLHFADPSRIRYSFMLEGLDREWGQPGEQRQVRYAGLSPGSYRLLVRASNSDGVWSEPHELLTAVIHPPPWQTSWAYLAYFLTAILLMLLAYGLHRRQRRVLENEVSARTRQLQEQQAQVSRQATELREALEARSQFFASISHEFRTPLTLILSSLERLETAGAETVAIERGRRYARLLLSLVDQLLDLSRLRAHGADTSGQSWSLTKGVGLTVDAFVHVAQQRDLDIRADLEPDWWTACSQQHVERILLNLLDNAMKFTTPGDSVEVRLSGKNELAVLEVIDSGPGIPPEEQDRVFEQFHRSAEVISEGVDGAGIGLALVRETALALGGDVTLDSEPGRGSRFRVSLPAFRDESRHQGDETRPAVEPSSDSVEIRSVDDHAAFDPDPELATADLGTVLVVEDNTDLREYLRHTLQTQWGVIEAADGQEGLELAMQHHPDLIVSDVMMPRLDGFGFLEALRGCPETSHIPILLLTARQDSEARLKGLALSADDFMAKPFDAEELRVRLRRMIDNRERMRRFLLSEASIELSGKNGGQQELVHRDRELIDRINTWLAENLDDSDLDVESLCQAMTIERRTLQRKLKALTGMTPAAYIRHIRLRQAKKLLLETDRSINEIALRCGFSNAQHFSRLFRKNYQVPPERWRRQARR